MPATRVQSKCDKNCDTDANNKQTRKSTDFKSNALSFYTTDFSYLNIFPQKIDQIFGFWAGQSLKAEIPAFVDISLCSWRTRTQQILKCWSFQKCEHQPFVFRKVPIWQRLRANQLGGFEYNFRCLELFSSNLTRNLRSSFLLKLPILKVRLLLTSLRCLLLNSD